MYCTNCGKTIEDGSDFCPFCGAKQLTASPERKTTGSETVKIMADKKQTSRKKVSKPALGISAALIAISLLLTLFGWLKPANATVREQIKNTVIEEYEVPEDELAGYRAIKDGSLSVLEIPAFYELIEKSLDEGMGEFPIELKIEDYISNISLYSTLFFYASVITAIIAYIGLWKGNRWSVIPFAICMTALVLSIVIIENKMQKSFETYALGLLGYSNAFQMILCFPAYLSCLCALAAAAVAVLGTESVTPLPVVSAENKPYTEKRAIVNTERRPAATSVLNQKATETTLLHDNATETTVLSGPNENTRILRPKTIPHDEEMKYESDVTQNKDSDTTAVQSEKTRSKIVMSNDLIGMTDRTAHTETKKTKHSDAFREAGDL